MLVTISNVNKKKLSQFQSNSIQHLLEDQLATSTSPSKSILMTDANLHPSVVLIRDRLRDIFPEIQIPLDIIGWHIRQSTSIETICENFATEILSFGGVRDPTKDSHPPPPPTTTTTCTPIKDDTLQTLYDVFNTIPRPHIEEVYSRLKKQENPHWYDDIVNELLSYDMIQPTTTTTTNKRSFDDEMNGSEEISSDGYERLLAILPDIDPDYAMESYMTFLETSMDSSDLNSLVTSLIERGYEKFTTKLERRRNERLKENLREPKFEIDEFLKTFPNPLEYFYDRTKTVSESYKNHAYIYLANAFARLSSDYIREILNANNYRFAPAMKQLQEEFYTYHARKPNHGGSKRLNHRARAPIAIPDVPDEIFYKDLCYTKHEDEIIEYLSRKQEFRDEQIRLAKANGTLQTCDCCCDDQLLDDDMITCENHHRFCQTCVRNYIENTFYQQGQCLFTCLNPSCKSEYSTVVMGQLLAPTVFSRLLIKIQQEELRRANIPNFEQCKYCTFGTIIDDPNERIFRCLNQECLKETCRTCGESNHIPLRCDEVEKRDELDMRTFIENRVSEAMIRICYKCKQRFYKLEGCNKMTCACGASMCYVCREPIQGYEHFTNNTKCNAHDDVIKLHQEEMRAAYDEAKQAYLERHPEAAELVLRYDPQQHISGEKKFPKQKAKRGRHRR